MKNSTQKQAQVDKLVRGEISLHSLPDSWSEVERSEVRLKAVAKTVQNSEILTPITTDEVLEKAKGKNCENMAGLVGIPLGVVGPVKIEGETPFFIPLATTEGALVASASRGAKALGLSQRLNFYLDDRGMTRAPVFVVDSINQAKKVMEWLELPEAKEKLVELTSQTSSHLGLKNIKTKLVGRNLFIKFFFDSGAAMGMNMATIATEKMSVWLENKFQMACVSVSGNGCVDKKPSWGSVMEGRGIYAQAEVVIANDVLVKVLKTTGKKLAEVVTRKNYIGGAAFGSMGFNAHFANLVAAFYLATGQDPAHTVEGSVGITTAEVVEGGVYFSVTLPNVLLGVVGGGTALPYQKRSLQMMGINSPSKDNKLRLARNLAYVVMAGELSLLASLASGTLAGAHQKHGRGKE